MGGKAHQNATDSPKAEVGEIDTRAPFESVKAAVSLFGEGAIAADKFTMKKPKSIPTERTLTKETQLHMAEKELIKFKEQLNNAGTTKAQALTELEKAKRTVEDLTHKLKTVNESKESAIEATEVAKNQAKQLEGANSGNPSKNGGSWKEELDGARQQYATAVTELNAAKQELQKIRQDFQAYMGEKAVAFQQAANAEHATVVNKERADELSKEIASAQESLVRVKLASELAQLERVEILSEKDTQKQTTRLALHEMENKLELLKKEFDPEVVRNLEEKLAETSAEIATLQKQMESARVSNHDSMKSVTTNIDSAKLELQKLSEEESSLRTLVESLKQELESVKKDHTELKDKEADAENITGNMHIKLQKHKAELEVALAGENKARAAVDELASTLQQLSFESKNARIEIETMNKGAEAMKRVAEMTRIASEEAEKKLQVALNEAEEVKAAEASALDQIKILSVKTDAARASMSMSESGAQITMSAEEYESMSRKVEESNMLAEMKVAAAVAQVEAVKASENEVLKRLEAAQKEAEEMQVATQEALKRAEMAEAAKQALEGEIRRWREREQKRAAEAANLILSETEMSKEPSPVKRTASEKVAPYSTGHKILMTTASGKPDGRLKMEKSFTTKKMRLSDLSGIFHRKKNQVEGASPSCRPGKKPL
eukprot:TRINITY_DN28783_c0_g1_i1.p1 TRINITY_DN28783_c0_g1~~TRINITY_DN28783_c0_g1_i1.p1  ORF type:complete len:665 (-),score=211.98 TRINITY_DN28783_c0_g1_i1:282-2276(-)